MSWRIPKDTDKFSDAQLARLFPVEPWAHQLRSLRGILRNLSQTQATSFCLPTGGGKSLVNLALLNLCNAYNEPAIIYTNRKLLTKQTSDGLTKFGVDHGVRAASMPLMQNFDSPIQISSVQTEIARCINGDQALHKAKLVVVDEAHQYGGAESLKVLQSHLADDCKLVLVSGTPLELNHLASSVVVGATNTELLACKAHVPVIVKSLHQMDVSRVRRVKEKYDVDSIVRESWSQAIVGHVLEDYLRFNPEKRMGLGVAPGVPESRAMAQYFYQNGIKAAHVDATEVWVDGEYYRDNTTGDRRNEIVERWRSGDIQFVWNCQVFREAFDAPNLYHLILATPICSLKDYIQTVGRVLRYSDATPDHVIVQDHAGNCYRHGHPNDDRDWEALYNMTEKEIREEEDKRRDNEKPEEVSAVCPKCGTELKFGRCPPQPLGCGEDIAVTNPRKLRFVVQRSGELVDFDPIAAKKAKKEFKPVSQEQKQWNDMYFSICNSKSSKETNFNSARFLYFKRHKKWPPKNLSNMPVHDDDWKRNVKSVSRSDLRRTEG